jgi:two-component system, NtrC family, sensor kinase
MNRAIVLLVDDDDNLRSSLELALRRDFEVRTAASAPEAFAILEQEKVDIVVSDHRMPGTTGAEFLRQVADRYPDTERLMLTGHADAEVASDAINRGAVFRFLTKPIDERLLRVIIARAVKHLDVERENRWLRELVSRSPELRAQLENAPTRQREGGGE